MCAAWPYKTQKSLSIELFNRYEVHSYCNNIKQVSTGLMYLTSHILLGLSKPISIHNEFALAISFNAEILFVTFLFSENYSSKFLDSIFM